MLLKQVIKIVNGDDFQELYPEPLFIRVELYDTEDGPAYYTGLAAQLSGNDEHATILLLSTSYIHPDYADSFKPGKFMHVFEPQWNGGEEVKGRDKWYARTRYRKVVLDVINKEARRLGKEMIALNKDYNTGILPTRSYNESYQKIYQRAEEIWLNQDESSRFPEWFGELEVPRSIKNIFDEIFGDFKA